MLDPDGHVDESHSTKTQRPKIAFTPSPLSGNHLISRPGPPDNQKAGKAEKSDKWGRPKLPRQCQ